MGTQFNVIFYASDSLVANRAYRAVSARMDSLNQIMSDYLDGSEINRLSHTAGSGQWVIVSPELFDVLRKAKFIAQVSHGRFDPTVGPLSLLWRRAVRRKGFPSAKERRRARRAVGYQFMDLDSTTRSVRLRRVGMRLDVGGIGQGFAIDEAQKVLNRFGIRSCLIDLGGDVLAGDAPPVAWTATSGRNTVATTTSELILPGHGRPGYGWRVGIGSVETGDTATITLTNAAITTSGDTYRHLDYRGQRYSHIMNPRSGLGLRHFVRATIIAPDGYRADALTKVFSVARGWPSRWRKSRQLLKRFPNVELDILENKNGRLHRWQSAGFTRNNVRSTKL